MLLSGLCCAAAFVTTSWRAPWPRVWTAEDGSFALSVTPTREKTLLRLYCLDAGGRELTLWRNETDFYPAKVMISPDAHVVMLNEYPGFSARTAVAVSRTPESSLPGTRSARS